MKAIVTATITCNVPLTKFAVNHFESYKNVIYRQLVNRLENSLDDSKWDIVDFEVKQQ